MALTQRLPLYATLEKERGRPLLVFATSSRRGAAGMIATDSVAEFLSQLELLPPKSKALDLLVVSNGGDPTVAQRLVSLIRERVPKFSVLIPEAAFSAATLIALGADEIVMHQNGNLGPVDAQIESKKGDNQQSFGSEDLAAFINFAKEQVGISDQAELAKVFERICADVGAVPIGVAARSAQLMVSLGERLLQLHMGARKDKAKGIAQALAKKFYHHGYPVGRKEARVLGLKVETPSPRVEAAMWGIWCDIRDEMMIREPFDPGILVASNPACAAFFAPPPVLSLPANLPPNVFAQIMNQVMAQAIVSVPATEFSQVNALLESSRLATRFVTSGKIFATRGPDQGLRFPMIPEAMGWRTIELK